MKSILGSFIISLGIALASPAHASTSERAVSAVLETIGSMTGASAPASAPLKGEIEIGFSPEGSGLELVLKTIHSARTTIDVMAYSFTSAEVTSALRAALKRGVAVRVVVDQNQNFKGDSRLSAAALSTLQLAGAQVRTISVYPSAHDKLILVDGKHSQTGSFNYSKAAATRNSENVLVIWNNTEVAKIYTAHFMRNWKQAQAFTGR